MSLASTDLPRRHRLTVSDYYRMAEVGILSPDARVELIDGEIIDMVPPGSLHAATVRRLRDIFSHAAGDSASVHAQDPVRLSEHTELQTDIALVRHREDSWLVDLLGQRLIRHRAARRGVYTLVDEPDLGTPLEVSALSGVVVDLQKLFGG